MLMLNAGLHDGADVKFHQIDVHKRSFVSYYKFRSQKLQY